MSEKDTKLRDCFLINEFTARDLQKMFLVYGRRDIDHIEFGCPPERWVKIVYGRESPETSRSEAQPSATGQLQISEQGEEKTQ